jgi:hypothetical protein
MYGTATQKPILSSGRSHKSCANKLNGIFCVQSSLEGVLIQIQTQLNAILLEANLNDQRSRREVLGCISN